MADKRVRDLPNTTSLTLLGNRLADLLLLEQYQSGGDPTNPANNLYQSDNIILQDFVNSLLSVNSNILFNAGCQIDQRNEGAALSVPDVSSGFPIDGWIFGNTGSGATATVQRDAGTDIFPNSAKITAGTGHSIIATTNTSLSFSAEAANCASALWGTANAKSVVFSGWMKTSITGTFSVYFTNRARNRSYVSTITISAANTWTYFVLVIPGDTTGTWQTGAGLSGITVGFDTGSGSNVQGAAGAWAASLVQEATGATQLLATNGATMNVTGMWMRIGTFDVPKVLPSYEDDLRRCQRLFFKTFPPGVAPAQNAGVSGALTVKNPIAMGLPGQWLRFPVGLSNAASLQITTYNPSAANANWRNITQAADVAVSVDPAANASVNGVFLATSAAVVLGGDILAIHMTCRGVLG